MSTSSPRTPEDWLAQREARRRSELRARLAASVAMHVGLIALLMVAPAPAPTALPAVVRVELMARVPAASQPVAKAPAPEPQVAKEPAPTPPAPPPPPKPPEKVKVLPKEAPTPKPVPKQPEPQAKPAPKPPNRPREKPKELDYDDALAALRGELGEKTAAPEAEQQTGETADSASGTSVDPELARWQGTARNHVSARWVDPPEFRNRGLQTELRITLLGDGSLLGSPTVVRSSGDPFADDNAVRAILQSAPLPPPPRSGDYTFIFRPEDTP